uniref:Uncharacterized protein n=1 Tax=Glossina morsitans morsitans TaxID=37546 RepID=A0A1B0FFU7_GLOMM
MFLTPVYNISGVVCGSGIADTDAGSGDVINSLSLELLIIEETLCDSAATTVGIHKRGVGTRNHSSSYLFLCSISFADQNNASFDFLFGFELEPS